MFEVLIETANRDPRQVRCLNAACGIGRGEDNLVILQGWNIAREHATLSARRNGVFIEVLSGRAPIASLPPIKNPVLPNILLSVTADISSRAARTRSIRFACFAE